MKSVRHRSITPGSPSSFPFFQKENSNIFFESGKTFFKSNSSNNQAQLKHNYKSEQKNEVKADITLQRNAISSDANASNNTHGLSIQRKCATCEYEEEKIQKKEADAPANPSTLIPQTDTTAPTATTGSIVDDNVVPAPGQMRKTEFLNRLKEEICVTVNQALAGTRYSSDNCPYIQASFARHQNSSPSQIEALINRYCSSAAQAQSAEGIIQQMKLKVYVVAKQWATSGGNLGDVSQIFGGVAGGIDSAIGGIASSFGGMFFKANDGGANTSQSPQSVMQSLGRGQSLDSHSKGKMESAFRTDFSNVEIHTDSNAANLSNNMNARAFTVGNHIAFASGEHKPGTLIGDALMAHELAHTLQQSQLINEKSSNQNQLSENILEKDADRSATEAVLGMWSRKDSADNGTILPKIKSGLSISRCKSCPKEPKIEKTLSVFELAGNKMNVTNELQGAIKIWKSEAGIVLVPTIHPKISEADTRAMIGTGGDENNKTIDKLSVEVNPTTPTSEEQSLAKLRTGSDITVFFVPGVIFGGWTNTHYDQIYVSEFHCEDGFTIAHEVGHLLIGTGHGEWSSDLMHPNNCIGHDIDALECKMARGDINAKIEHSRNRSR